MDKLHMIAHIILVVMGLNVGLGLLGMDVLGVILGAVPMLPMIWMLLVGASAAYCAFLMVTGKHKH